MGMGMRMDSEGQSGREEDRRFQERTKEKAS